MEYKVLLTILCLLIYAILSVNYHKLQNTDTSYWFTFILLSIYVLWAGYGGDYWHYHDLYENIYDPYIHAFLEPPYIWVGMHVPSYLFFRAVFWCGGLILTIFTLKNFGILSPKTFCGFYIILACTYGVARASVALIVFLYSLSLLYRADSRILKFAGYIVLLLSVYFHKQIAIILLIYVFANLVKPTKSNIVIFFLLGVALLSTLRFYINNFLDSYTVDYDDDSMISMSQNKASIYLDKENSAVFVTSPSGILLQVLTYSPVVYTFFWYFKNYDNVQNICGRIISTIFGLSSYIIAFSVILAFVVSGFSTVVFRVINMSMFPVAIFSMYCLYNNVFLEYVNRIVKMQIVYTIYVFVYFLYCTFLSGKI